MESLVPSVMIIGDKTNQPCWASEVWSMSYVSILIYLLVATWGNQLLHLVNLRRCVFRMRVRHERVLFVGDVPIKHSMYGHN